MAGVNIKQAATELTPTGVDTRTLLKYYSRVCERIGEWADILMRFLILKLIGGYIPPEPIASNNEHWGLWKTFIDLIRQVDERFSLMPGFHLPREKPGYHLAVIGIDCPTLGPWRLPKCVIHEPVST